MMALTFVEINETNVERVIPLFNFYRQFYECEPDTIGAHAYLLDRMQHQQSTIFLATDTNSDLGFVQLYPTFCSVQMTKVFVLYDLFVVESSRGKGVGRKLMKQASMHAKSESARRIDLRTAFSNLQGQALYESLGYERVLENFHTYSLQI